MDLINYRAPLGHTHRRLTEDKELRVVYFGGSVTAGHGSSDSSARSWRALIGQWLSQQFPSARIENINRALGESGTYLGANRVQMDIIPARPDLLFIEYAINDRYFESTYERAASQFETIIREVRTALPKTDIVAILVTDKACLEKNRVGKLHTQAQAHEDIARAYDVPTVHAGRYLAQTAEYSPENWSKYAIDIVHPNDAGYAVYYQIIREFMYNSLFCTDFAEQDGQTAMPPIVSERLFDGARAHIIPSQALLERSRALGGIGVEWTDESVFGNAAISEQRGRFYFADGDVLALRFCGTEISAYVFESEIDWSVSVDGGEYETVRSGSHNPTVFASGLESGEHVLRIKPTSAGKVCIGAMFTRDATLATRRA